MAKVADINENTLYRIAECERVNAQQQQRIEDAQKTLAEIAGAQHERQQAENKSGRLVGPAIAVCFALLSGFVSYSVLRKIDDLSIQMNGLSIAAATREERVTNLESRKIPDLTEIQKQLAEFSTTLEVLKTSAIGEVETDRAHTAAISANEKNIAQLNATTSSALIEVETQLRSLNEVVNLELVSIDRNMQVVWQKSGLGALPDKEYYSNKIPAQATTILGNGALK